MTTYVLVPGAGGVARYWKLAGRELTRRGHEVVAVDLPGDDDRAGLSEYAEAVVEAAGGRTGVVLVAQSMGGFTAPLVCERLRPRELVLLNAMVPAPGETAGEWWGNTGQAEARKAMDVREGRDPAAEFDLATYFLHDLAEDLVAEVLATDRDQSETPFGEPWPLDSWPEVPTTVLAGRDDRFFPAEFQRRVARERLGLDVEELPGGHLAALSHPVELADRLACAS